MDLADKLVVLVDPLNLPVWALYQQLRRIRLLVDLQITQIVKYIARAELPASNKYETDSCPWIIV